MLQCGVNIGILMAVFANHLMARSEPKYLFLVGIIPALLVFWIRRAVPETEEWQAAKKDAHHHEPKLSALFQGDVWRVTLWTMVVCGISLTAHWAFMFWHVQHLRNLPEVLSMTSEERNKLASLAMYLVIGSSIAGNFFSGWLAKRLGYRATIGATFFVYFVVMCAAYCTARDHHALLWWFPVIGFCQGVFGLFTMYLPPLFPHPAPHHRRRLLLQHRPRHLRRGRGVLRLVLQSGRSPAGVVLRRISLPASSGDLVPDAEGEGLIHRRETNGFLFT